MAQVTRLKQRMEEVRRERNNQSITASKETNLAQEKQQVQIHVTDMGNHWDTVNRKESLIIMMIDIIKMIDIIQIKRI